MPQGSDHRSQVIQWMGRLCITAVICATTILVMQQVSHMVSDIAGVQTTVDVAILAKVSFAMNVVFAGAGAVALVDAVRSRRRIREIEARRSLDREARRASPKRAKSGRRS